jgi:hypothetical protein
MAGIQKLMGVDAVPISCKIIHFKALDFFSQMQIPQCKFKASTG